jgi:hypothetical protein
MQVQTHFLDSGAFSQILASQKWRAKNRGAGEWDYYDTPEFFAYVDEYAAFVKEHHTMTDLYASMDVIGNPELTWKNQKYLEDKHGLSPVPTIHYGTPPIWIEKYLSAGYKYIALGGLVGGADADGFIPWLDRAWRVICNTPDKMPRAKVHGFGVTSYFAMTQYPWCSVDSTSWLKLAAYGKMPIPRPARKGKEGFRFEQPPYIIRVTWPPHLSKKEEEHDLLVKGRAFTKKASKRNSTKHYYAFGDEERANVDNWLKYIGVPMGKYDEEKEKVVEDGVQNHHAHRNLACMMYFQELVKQLPPYPQPLKRKLKPVLMPEYA